MSTQVKEHPIIFSSESIRAILNNSKTQSRRVIKPQPLAIWDKCEPAVSGWCFYDSDDPDFHGYKRCPYGQVGDRLWVREKFYVAYPYSYGTLPSGDEIQIQGIPKTIAHYAADGDPPNTPNRHYPFGLRGGAFSAPDPYAIWFKHPSIHMPRWASRIDVENIIDPFPQRLQEITEEGAEAEGFTYHIDEFQPGASYLVSAKEKFNDYWDFLNAKRGYGWETNPWVWVVSFAKFT